MTRTLLTTALLAALASSALYAQTSNLKAEIPFGFQAGSAVMPAGHYTIVQSGFVLTLRKDTGKPAATMILVRPDSRRASNSKPELVFNRYGNDYFLSSVWTANSKAGHSLPKTSRERELAARAAPIQTAAVPLQSK